jgi:hypothetical protein
VASLGRIRTGLRFLIASSTVVCSALGAAPAFAADFPTPTVSTPHGSLVAERGSYCTADYVASTSGCADMMQSAGPELVVDPNGEVKITLDGDADEFVAYLSMAPVAAGVTQTGPREYTVSLPSATTFPVRLGIFVETRTAAARWSNSWDVRLVAPPAPPAQPQPDIHPFTAPAPEPAATIAPASLKLTGKRLAVSVVCPAAAKRACSGTLTLKTSSLCVARLGFTNVAPGTTKTLRTTVRGAALRHLARHHTRNLRSVLTATGGTPAASQLRVR